ncbi:MAG: right-handed parallel beta-helix repeat-containing protein [Polyangiaceae bacterium]
MTRPTWVFCLIGLAAAACGDDSGGGATGGAPNQGGGGAGASATGGTGAGASDGGTSLGGSGGVGPMASCAPLAAPMGNTVSVGPSDDVAAAIEAAPAGTTILLADGQYDVPEGGYWIRASGVTLRSASGDPDAVVLDAGYATVSGGVVNVADQSDVTVAELTIRRGRYHAIHVSATAAPANGVRIYRVHVIDPGEQGIKINNAGQGYYTDAGEVACSTIELTDAGRAQVMSYDAAGSHCYTGGIDAHGSRGFHVHHNVVRGFWCSNGDLSEHGIHFWRGSRDTLIEDNLLVDDARGIGLGLDSTGRTYADNPCPGVSEASHYGGVVRDNFIVATRPELFASPNGMDGGIALAYACGATVAHNTIASTEAPFASIEWRFDTTSVELVNNLAMFPMRERDGATATQAGNISDAPAASFVDLAGFDLHLADNAAARGAGDDAGAALAPTDYDGDVRPTSAPDVGADESAP